MSSWHKASVSRRQSNIRKTHRISRATAILVAVGWVIVSSDQTQALPSFARQTGQPCATCHVDFPQLTPFGRRFKLGGYTMGGGEKAETYKKAFGSDQWVPPVSMMGVVGFTKTQASQDATGQPFAPNNNLVAEAFSVFYGGAITENLGAFVQATLSGPASHFGMDNADVRYVKSVKIGDADVLLGITAHNNPTVQDVWNTVPAWGFPFVSSSVAPTPGAATMIDSTLGQRVVGLGAYAFINNVIYLEATGYKGLNPRQMHAIGVSPTDASGLNSGISPYFRIAAEPNWGNHWFQFGAFGLMTSVKPFASPDINTVTFPGTDKYTDLGLDSQYQYMGGDNIVTLRAVYLHEMQKLDSSFANGLAANATNKLNTVRASASLAHGTINRVVVTGGYFKHWGSTDALLYAANTASFSPNSDGWIAELAYIPFNTGNSPLWPWANARLGLQYIWYNKFDGASANYDGTGRNARDNNTLYAYLWFSM